MRTIMFDLLKRTFMMSLGMGAAAAGLAYLLARLF